MKFSHDKSWDFLEETLNKNLTIVESWERILEFHAKFKKKKYWTKLSNLSIETEQSELTEWLESIQIDSPIPNEIVAFWIGITKLWDEENEKEVCTIYLIGAKTYEKDDIEWAVNCDFEPENKYFISDVLNFINDEIEEDEEDYSFLDWILPLSYCCLTFKEIINQKLDRSKFIQSFDMSVGFDDGDYISIT
jgi:hypothetical protein